VTATRPGHGRAGRLPRPTPACAAGSGSDRPLRVALRAAFGAAPVRGRCLARASSPPWSAANFPSPGPS